MPDWVHPIIYIAVMAAAVYLALYYTQNLLGLLLGLGFGHFLAAAIVKNIPGFWGS